MTQPGESNADLAYPIKLNDRYPCQGVDANGASLVFPDLLNEGEQVGPAGQEDGGEALYVSGVVVRRDDGLWVESRSSGRTRGTLC